MADNSVIRGDDAEEKSYEAAKLRAQRIASASGFVVPNVKSLATKEHTPFERYLELAFEPLDGTTAARRSFAAFNMSFALMPFLAVHATYQLHAEDTRRALAAAEMAGGPGVVDAGPKRTFAPPKLNFETVSTGCRLAAMRFIPLTLSLCIIYGVEFTARRGVFTYFMTEGRAAAAQARMGGKEDVAVRIEAQVKDMEGTLPHRSNFISRGVAGVTAGLTVGGTLRYLRVGLPPVWWAVPVAALGGALGAQMLPDWEKLPRLIGGGGRR